MEHRDFKDYLYQCISLIIVGIIFICCWFGFQNIDLVKAFFTKISRICQPIEIGLVLAYLTSPFYNVIRDFLVKKISSKSFSEKQKLVVAKSIASMLSLALVIAVVLGLLLMIIPQLIQSIMGIWNDVPKYAEGLNAMAEKFIDGLPAENVEIYNFVNNLYLSTEEMVNNKLATFNIDQVFSIFLNVSSSITLVVKFVVNCFIGLIVMLYLLSNKEALKLQGKKIIFSVAGKVWGSRIIDEFRYVDDVFGQFIVGKLIDSTIIGIMTYFILDALKMPYPLLNAAIIGITNVIPFFGPFIGAVPASVLVFLASPKHLIPFIIFILLLQLFDGYILGPKILGSSTGLSGLWVLISILVFGGLWGFFGMIVAVPLFAVIYDLIRRAVKLKLRKLGIYDVTSKEFVNYTREPKNPIKKNSKEYRNRGEEKTIKIDKDYNIDKMIVKEEKKDIAEEKK